MSVRDAWSKGRIERICRQSETTKIQAGKEQGATHLATLFGDEQNKRGGNDESPKSRYFPHLIFELVQHYNLNRCRLQYLTCEDGTRLAKEEVIP